MGQINPSVPIMSLLRLFSQVYDPHREIYAVAAKALMDTLIPLAPEPMALYSPLTTLSYPYIQLYMLFPLRIRIVMSLCPSSVIMLRNQ